MLLKFLEILWRTQTQTIKASNSEISIPQKRQILEDREVFRRVAHRVHLSFRS
jgi:hypothetical protein